MKILFWLGCLIFTGAFLMFVSSYKVFSAMQDAGTTHLTKETVRVIAPGLQPYVMCGYLGLTLFAIGAVGALFVLIQNMSRRF